ncbi:hypothetical protein BOTCAL_0059g00070 [Botryotinia calthae]|uniref:Beta-lactamase-related domain-containing protein n=1 Tax=Botryotinia calthae TaxID=38488 RepID=A0A4Y8D9Z4_9HELO|nr:hypothetical protein BOTCAL_0059g00070 [Botryotinia calthae]
MLELRVLFTTFVIIPSIVQKRIHGHAEPRFMELLEAFQGYLETGEELGASIAVNIDGENVVDVWGGFRTQDKSENWERDTIVNVFSTTKTICKTLRDFVAQEIVGPLGVDFEIGASEEKLASDISSSKSFSDPFLDPSVVDSLGWREAEIGSANGYGNALSIATILSCISLGGKVNGASLLSNETIDLIFQEQSKRVDLVIGQKFRFGIGFGLPGNDTDLNWLPEGRVCMWGGYGGSIAIMDIERRLTISYTMNKLADVGLGSNRTKAYVGAIYNAIGS